MVFISNKTNSLFNCCTYVNRKTATYKKHKVNAPSPVSLFNVLVFFCLFISNPVYAETKSILIITNDHVPINSQVSTLLKNHFSEKDTISVSVHHYQNISRKQIRNTPAALIIALGIKASKLASPSSTPTLYTLIPENSLQDIGLCVSNRCPKTPKRIANNYAIYLDQPLSRQLNLLTSLLPSTTKIGVLTASFSHNKLKRLQLESKKHNLVLNSKYIKDESNLHRQLNELISNIDVLFTLPDPLINNRTNIPFLLLSTYRYNIPVIGFSKAYVNAGAIAAVYSSAEQIALQISELAIDILFSTNTISNTYLAPKYFSIAINESVSHSLELHLPDKQTIKSKLLLLEK